jgi:uncharacterized protein RhaS with RHS repeats
MGADSYAWDYDPIGNREFFNDNGTTLDYLANQLNQYTNIANGVTLEPTYDDDGNTITAKSGCVTCNPLMLRCLQMGA